MVERHEWMDTFTRIGSRPIARRDDLATMEVLERFDDEHRLLLARFAGQTLAELEMNFQLLPLGTRIALSSVGALRQEDTGEDVFRVEALPFALDLVAAADRWYQTVNAHNADDFLETELTRIWDERFKVEKALPNDPAVNGSDLPDTVDVIGTFTAAAEVVEIDHAKQIGAVQIRGHHGDPLESAIVHFDLKPTQHVSAGKLVDAHFTVGMVQWVTNAKSVADNLLNAWACSSSPSAWDQD